MTFIIMNTGRTEQELENNVFQAKSIAQKHNCNLVRLDFQQEQGLMSSLPLANNLIDIQRGMTTSSTAIFVPFTTQELFQAGNESLYYGLNALSNNLIMVDRKMLKNPNGLILGTPGSGKSFAAKREIANAFLVTDDDVIISDPEAEYSPLDIEGICDNTTFMQWRLDIMADFIFKKLVTNRQAIYDEAIAMTGDLLEVRMTDGSSDKDKVENNIKQIDKLKKQIAVLVDMCTEGDISREVFRQKKQKLEDQIINLEKTNNECKQQILESEDDKLKQRRIESLTEFIKMQAFDPRAKIPETMIDVFVDRIVYDKGVFSWYLNPKLGNETFKVDTTDWKKSMLKSQKKRYPLIAAQAAIADKRN